MLPRGSFGIFWHIIHGDSNSITFSVSNVSYVDYGNKKDDTTPSFKLLQQ